MFKEKKKNPKTLPYQEYIFVLAKPDYENNKLFWVKDYPYIYIFSAPKFFLKSAFSGVIKKKYESILIPQQTINDNNFINIKTTDAETVINIENTEASEENIEDAYSILDFQTPILSKSNNAVTKQTVKKSRKTKKNFISWIKKIFHK